MSSDHRNTLAPHFSFDDGSEHSLKFLEVYRPEACGNAAVHDHKHEVLERRILNEDVSWVQVSMDEVVDE